MTRRAWLYGIASIVTCAVSARIGATTCSSTVATVGFYLFVASAFLGGAFVFTLASERLSTVGNVIASGATFLVLFVAQFLLFATLTIDRC